MLLLDESISGIFSNGFMALSMGEWNELGADDVAYRKS